MNLLEHYIVDIHSVKRVKQEPWMNEPFLEVDITIDCYGIVERKIEFYPSSYWEGIKEKGYYMG